MTPLASAPRALVWAVAVAGSVAASSLAHAEPSTTEPPKTQPPKKGRRTVDEPTEIEVLNFVDEYERDPQAFAVGLSGGMGGLSTKGSANRVVPAATFSFTFDFGLGPGGARIPWSLEPFAAFAITPASFNSDVQVFPDRFTELGARLVYRGSSGLLQDRFVSLGLGLVWTSYGSCTDPALCDNRHDLAPAGLVDVGFGLVEWSTRSARYGFLLATPIEASKHPGLGVFGCFYGQLGLGR